MTVFDAAAFDEILESLVDALEKHRRKEQSRKQVDPKAKSRQLRAVVVVPGFTPTARVLASITRHPKPEVRKRLRVATVIACINPENVFADDYQVDKFFEQPRLKLIPRLLSSCFFPSYYFPLIILTRKINAINRENEVSIKHCHNLVIN